MGATKIRMYTSCGACYGCDCCIGCEMMAPKVVALGSVAQALLVSTQNKTYLDCPYAEKVEAKHLDARWDPDLKKWYIPPGKHPFIYL